MASDISHDVTPSSTVNTELESINKEETPKANNYAAPTLPMEDEVAQPPQPPTSDITIVQRPVSPASSTMSNSTSIASSVKKKADIEVVCRDILMCYLDLAGDIGYLVFLYLYQEETAVRQHRRFEHNVAVLLTVSIIGLVLSFWLIAASFERKCRGRMSWCCCTVPRLSMYQTLLHHIPICILVSLIDLNYMGGYTIAGVVNIGTSMIAMANALRTTKCGESCGDCGSGDTTVGNELSVVNGMVADDDEYFEKASTGSGTASTNDDSIETDYKAMV